VVFQETFDLRNGFPRDFLTWMPMVAVGPQVPMGSCRVAVVARGGFFLSDLSPTAGERQFNAGAVYGLGGYLNCDEVIDIAAAIARVHFDDRPVDVIQSEIQLPVIPAGEHQLSVGVRAEYLNVRESGGVSFLFESPRVSDTPLLRTFVVISLRQRIR
jgi:hypothetical protein